MGNLGDRMKMYERHETGRRFLPLLPVYARTDKAPYWAHIFDDGKFARLTIRGKTTALRWPDAEMEWDCCTLETEEVSFPTRLLFISDGELATWKLEQARKCEREEAQRGRERQREKEAAERAEFERLKARYG